MKTSLGLISIVALLCCSTPCSGDALYVSDVTQQRVDDPFLVIWEGLAEVGRQSQVVHFSMQNLFTIGLIGISLLGVGYFGIGAVGRSIESNSILAPLDWIEANDAIFVLAFLLGEHTYVVDKESRHSFQCLNRLSCLEDKRAYNYLTAAKMFIKGTEFLDPIFGEVMDRYRILVDGLYDAIEYKQKGGNCRKRYSCEEMPSL